MRTDAGAWRGRTVLVTGCTGFLGRALASRLAEDGARVLGLVRPGRSGGSPDAPPPASRASSPDAPPDGRPGERSSRTVPEGVEPVPGDLRDAAALAAAVGEHPVDAVFHLAGQSSPARAARDPAATFETNVGGTWRLLDAVRASGRPVPVVLASSDAVYGDGGPFPYDEGSPAVGASPYAVSKRCAEEVAGCYAERFDVPVAVARLSNVYGPGDRDTDRIVPGTVAAALRDEDPVIRSDGTPEREYLYLDDAVDGLLRLGAAALQPGVRGATFNLTTGEPVSVLDLVETILDVLGRSDRTPRVLGREGSRSRVHSTPERARARLGWQARTPLEAGLGRTVAWHRREAAAPAAEVGS